jgi:hypothetical protein
MLKAGFSSSLGPDEKSLFAFAGGQPFFASEKAII